MENAVMINNNSLPIMEYQGKRVVTLKDIDRIHERPNRTAQRNFGINKKHFILDEDYYEISRNDYATKFVALSKRGNPQSKIFLFTETGYLMIVKSFTDDLAWQVQRQLVNGYFKLKELADQQPIAKQEIQTLNTHIYSKICLMVDEKIKTSLAAYDDHNGQKEYEFMEAIKEMMQPQQTTVHYIDYHKQEPNAIIKEAIKPLAELFNDGSVGYNGTFRKVYSEMNVNWKNRQTRYRNSRGNKTNPAKNVLIAENDNLLKLFLKTVNEMYTRYSEN